MDWAKPLFRQNLKKRRVTLLDEISTNQYPQGNCHQYHPKLLIDNKANPEMVNTIPIAKE
jgi:hypothetical protein